jgi:hypothetical protein
MSVIAVKTNFSRLLRILPERLLRVKTQKKEIQEICTQTKNRDSRYEYSFVRISSGMCNNGLRNGRIIIKSRCGICPSKILLLYPSVNPSSVGLNPNLDKRKCSITGNANRKKIG